LLKNKGFSIKTRQKSGFFDAFLRALTALKSLGGNTVSVQVRLPAPSQLNPNQILVTSDWFGFIFYLKNAV